MTNRLVNSTSPYLQQHADNPVDWWEWSPEAFEEARRRDVPIFLSIGYSACHWCHVMAHECFENDAMAEYLNENSDATLTVTQTGTNKPMVDFSRVPRGELRVRFEMYRKTNGDVFSHGTVMLDRTHFRRWLAQRGADYKTFMGEMQDESVIATP